MFTPYESEVLQTLTQLPHLIFQFEARRRFPFTWGCKRRRSAIHVTPSPPLLPLSSSPTPPPLHHTTAAAAILGPKHHTQSTPVLKAQASIPATPLSFSPSEADDNPAILKRKFPLKTKREEYLKIIEELSKSRDLGEGEIENVKGYYEELKPFNSKLEERKQELSLGLQLVHASVNSCSIAENQHQHQHRRALYVSNQATMSLPSINGFFNSGNNIAIPDLNLSVEECVPVAVAIDPSQHLLESMANRNLSRAMAAQARQNRIRIYRVKNPIRITKPRYSYR